MHLQECRSSGERMKGGSVYARRTESFAMSLGRAVRAAHTFATASFLLVILVAAVASDAASSAALAAALLLVKRAQGLSTKSKIFILNDDRADPGMCVEINFARGRVESAKVGHKVVRGRSGGGCL